MVLVFAVWTVLASVLVSSLCPAAAAAATRKQSGMTDDIVAALKTRPPLRRVTVDHSASECWAQGLACVCECMGVYMHHC